MLLVVAGGCVGGAADGAGTPRAMPAFRVAWVVGNSLGLADLTGKRVTIPLPDVPGSELVDVSWFPDHRRLALLRTVRASGTSTLELVDTRTRSVKATQLSIQFPSDGSVDVAISRRGRIAVALTKYASGRCTAADPADLAVYVLDQSGFQATELPVFPTGFVRLRDSRLLLGELSWSSRDELSYVVDQFRPCPSGTDFKSTVVATHARGGEQPRALVTFWNDERATAWARDGRKLAFGYLRTGAHTDVTVVGQIGPGLRERHVWSFKPSGLVVDVSWLASTFLLYENFDGEVDLYTVDLGTRRKRLVLKPDRPGQRPGPVVDVSSDGRYVALAPFDSSFVSVFDIRTRHRWIGRIPRNAEGYDAYLR
jgi:hypothetical protein